MPRPIIYRTCPFCPIGAIAAASGDATTSGASGPGPSADRAPQNPPAKFSTADLKRHLPECRSTQLAQLLLTKSDIHFVSETLTDLWKDATISTVTRETIEIRLGQQSRWVPVKTVSHIQGREVTIDLRRLNRPHQDHNHWPAIDCQPLIKKAPDETPELPSN